MGRACNQGFPAQWLSRNAVRLRGLGTWTELRPPVNGAYTLFV